ncbi:MAG: DUF3137 domain-containing protein [Chrysiogenetes bacterium]|nr:DUF3137 domain-containing protein [Chrysiogenetes bacterium]
MKSLEQLLEFYRANLLEELGLLELQRRRIRNVITAMIIVGALGLAGSIGVGAAGIIPPWAAALTAIGAIAGAVIVGAKTFAAFRARYKSQVIAPIISFLDPSFTYDPEAHLGKNELLDCALFPEKASMLSGEDLITGKLEGRAFRVSEIMLRGKESRADKETTHEYFHGLFLALSLGRTIGARVWLRTPGAPLTAEEDIQQKLEEHFLALGEAARFRERDESLELEVRAEDIEVALDTLTLELADRMRAFAARQGGRVYGAFVGEHFYLAAESQNDYFEPSVWNKLVSREDIESFHADFEAFLAAAAAAIPGER